MKNNLKFVGFLMLVILFFYAVPPFLIELSGGNMYSVLVIILGTMFLIPISIGMVIGYYRELNLRLFDEN
jgi:hypothetical protein